MAQKKGHKKIGGREKGTPNRASLIVRDILAAKGLDAIEEVLTLMEGLKPGDKLQVWTKLLPYCYPQLKAIEISGNPDRPLTVDASNMAALYAAAASAAREGASYEPAEDEEESA